MTDGTSTTDATNIAADAGAFLANRGTPNPALPRHINADGVALIKEYEGLHLTPYLCPGKVWSIGYGHTRSVYAGMRITREDADRLLEEDLRLTERVVSRVIRVNLNDNQFSALVSFAFNIGAGNFETSELVRRLNYGFYQSVPPQLLRWNHAGGEMMGGLSRRRAAEAQLWNKTIGLAGV